MKRLEKHPQITYNAEKEPFHNLLGISIQLMKLLLEQPNYSDLLGLYSFYYYTAKWQKTDQVKATILYTANGMGWGKDKVKLRKTQLRKLGLIEDITLKEKGRITGHFIRVIFVPIEDSTRLVSQPLENNAGNKEKNKSIKNSSSENGEITKSLFDQFWNMYPKKVSKGGTLTAWNKICNKPPEERPTWKDIRHAIRNQKKSEQWQDIKFIPHPSTWLNQNRWLDDPSQMVSYDHSDKPKSKIEDGQRWFLDADGDYVNEEGIILIE